MSPSSWGSFFVLLWVLWCECHEHQLGESSGEVFVVGLLLNELRQLVGRSWQSPFRVLFDKLHHKCIVRRLLAENRQELFHEKWINNWRTKELFTYPRITANWRSDFLRSKNRTHHFDSSFSASFASLLSFACAPPLVICKCKRKTFLSSFSFCSAPSRPKIIFLPRR